MILIFIRLWFFFWFKLRWKIEYFIQIKNWKEFSSRKSQRLIFFESINFKIICFIVIYHNFRTFFLSHGKNFDVRHEIFLLNISKKYKMQLSRSKNQKLLTVLWNNATFKTAIIIGEVGYCLGFVNKWTISTLIFYKY